MSRNTREAQIRAAIKRADLDRALGVVHDQARRRSSVVWAEAVYERERAAVLMSTTFTERTLHFFIRLGRAVGL